MGGLLRYAVRRRRSYTNDEDLRARSRCLDAYIVLVVMLTLISYYMW